MQHSTNEIDLQLIARIGGNDIIALAELYSRYYSKLLCLAVTRLKDRQEAECLVSDYFIDHVWKYRHRTAEIKNVKGYLNASINFRCATRFRKLERESAHKKEYGLTLTDVTLPDDRMETQQHEHELRKALHHALKLLTPQVRKVVEMVFLKGMTYGEIAAALDLKLKTVRKYIADGLQALAENNQLRVLYY